MKKIEKTLIEERERSREENIKLKEALLQQETINKEMQKEKEVYSDPAWKNEKISLLVSEKY